MRGYILWLIQPSDSHSVLHLLERLAEHGLSPYNPKTGEFRAWGTTTETAGEFWATSPLEHLSAWETGGTEEVAFDLWRQDCPSDREPDAQFVSILRRTSYFRISLSFYALQPCESEELTAALLWIALTEPVSVGLIVDRDLPESAEEWETFLGDPNGPLPSSADVAWLPERGPFGRSIFYVRPETWTRQGGGT